MWWYRRQVGLNLTLSRNFRMFHYFIWVEPVRVGLYSPMGMDLAYAVMKVTLCGRTLGFRES